MNFNGGIVFDLETTGIDPLADRIVTAYLGQMDHLGNIVQEVSIVVDPMVPIPAEAAEIHGYTSERARAEANSTPYEAVAWLHHVIVSEARLGRPVIGYNLQYDLTMLEAERARWMPNTTELRFYERNSAQSGIPVLDALVIDKAMDRFRKGSRKLIDTAKFYNVHLAESEAHGAKADAVASGRITIALLKRYPQLLREGIYGLHEKQIDWKRQQAASLQAYFRGQGGQPDAIVHGDWPRITNTTTERPAA